MNMVDMGPDTTGTLLVKDGSHLGHAPFFENACTLSHAEMAATADHYQLKPQELPFFDGFQSLGLRGRAGSVFLWDSRTIHAVSALSQGHSMSNVASLVIVLLATLSAVLCWQEMHHTWGPQSPGLLPLCRTQCQNSRSTGGMWCTPATSRAPLPQRRICA